jgi:hypothetical protein
MKIQDLKTIAKEKSISVFTFRKFVKMGLPHYRLGRKILVDPDEFDVWFRKHFKVCQQQADTDLENLVQDTFAKLNLEYS